MSLNLTIFSSIQHRTFQDEVTYSALGVVVVVCIVAAMFITSCMICEGSFFAVNIFSSCSSTIKKHTLQIIILQHYHKGYTL